MEKSNAVNRQAVIKDYTSLLAKIPLPPCDLQISLARTVYFFVRRLKTGLSPEHSHAPTAMKTSAIKYVYGGISRNTMRDKTVPMKGATA